CRARAALRHVARGSRRADANAGLARGPPSRPHRVAARRAARPTRGIAGMIALFGGPLSRIQRLALVLGLLLSAALMASMRGVTADATYVSLHIARHLAHGVGLVFNAGEPVYGTTNPLWVTLLADGMALGLDGLTCARVLGVASTLITVPLF